MFHSRNVAEKYVDPICAYTEDMKKRVAKPKQPPRPITPEQLEAVHGGASMVEYALLLVAVL